MKQFFSIFFIWIIAVFLGAFLVGSFFAKQYIYAILVIVALVMTILTNILVEQSDKIAQLNKRLEDLENKIKELND